MYYHEEIIIGLLIQDIGLMELLGCQSNQSNPVVSANTRFAGHILPTSPFDVASNEFLFLQKL